MELLENKNGLFPGGFLSTNLISILQPMDQSVTENLNKFYRKHFYVEFSLGEFPLLKMVVMTIFKYDKDLVQDTVKVDRNKSEDEEDEPNTIGPGPAPTLRLPLIQIDRVKEFALYIFYRLRNLCQISNCRSVIKSTHFIKVCVRFVSFAILNSNCNTPAAINLFYVTSKYLN